MNVGYRHLFEKIMRNGFGDSRSRVSVDVANEAWDYPDHQLGVVSTTVGSRCVVVIEGEREIVGPMIEDIYRRLDDAR